MSFVRGKFKVSGITVFSMTDGQENGAVELSAVTADSGIPEDVRYHKYTPSGKITMAIDNPPAFRAFLSRLGQSVYVDFHDSPELAALGHP